MTHGPLAASGAQSPRQTRPGPSDEPHRRAQCLVLSAHGQPTVGSGHHDVCGVGVDRLTAVGLDVAENNTRLDWGIGLSKTIMRALMSARMARYGEQERARMGHDAQAILDGDAIEKAEREARPSDGVNCTDSCSSCSVNGRSILSPV